MNLFNLVYAIPLGTHSHLRPTPVPEGAAMVWGWALLALPLSIVLVKGLVGAWRLAGRWHPPRSRTRRPCVQGEVLVTGATGGVGGFALALLAQRGHTVVAMTGKTSETDRLRLLGAARVVGRDAFASPSRPGRFALESETWSGAVDTVGGNTLASILARLAYGGAVAACGLVGGHDLDTTLFPFILRGVSLLGIDSVRCPREVRSRAWKELAAAFGQEALEPFIHEIALEDVPGACARILDGAASGRYVVDLSR